MCWLKFSYLIQNINPDENRDFLVIKNMKVAIQGINGSFHHQVAQSYFQSEILINECSSFDMLASSLVRGEVEKGVMALENSIAGSIIPNYALIDRHNLNIVGEYYLDINLNLMALKGQRFEDIKEVHSHPMAFLQCKLFFENHPHIKLVESSDTAFTARRIKEEQLKGIGALAAPIAADLYDLDIVMKSIHTIQTNKTRFVILKKDPKEIDKEEINKASIKFHLDDTPGSLATILNVMNNCKLNLSKIQSMPIIDVPFQYSFFVDVVFEKYKHYEKAKKIMELMTSHFKVLGEYKKAIRFDILE